MVREITPRNNNPGRRVPALVSFRTLWKAIVAHGYANPSFIWAHLDADVKQGRTDGLIRELRFYFTRLKPELLKAAA